MKKKCLIYSDKNEAIHDKLIGDLSTGFFGDSRSVYGNFERWRIYYAKHCPLPADEGKTVFEDLRTLQKKKLIKVGEYDVLLDIFQKVDISAIPIIKSARDSIQQNRETGRNEQRETKPGNKLFFLPFFALFKQDKHLLLTGHKQINHKKKREYRNLKPR